MNVLDNDSTVKSVRLESARYRVREGEDLQVKLVLSQSTVSGATVLISCGEASDSAEGGKDYRCPGSVRIPGGATSASFTIATEEDVLAEGEESFSLSIDVHRDINEALGGGGHRPSQ